MKHEIARITGTWEDSRLMHLFFFQQAGASAVDALRSIIISEQLLGTNEIVLVKHTGCGMLTFKNEDAYGIVEKNLG